MLGVTLKSGVMNRTLKDALPGEILAPLLGCDLILLFSIVTVSSICLGRCYQDKKSLLCEAQEPLVYWYVMLIPNCPYGIYSTEEANHCLERRGAKSAVPSVLYKREPGDNTMSSRAANPPDRPLIAKKAQRLFTGIHALIYRFTGGAILGRMMGTTVLILTTTGRKTGKQYTTPVLYLADGDRLVIVASNRGRPRNPTWWLNLQANPRTQVKVQGKTLDVIAEQASSEERSALWPRLTAASPSYADFQQRTTRELPVIILRPVGQGDAR